MKYRNTREERERRGKRKLRRKLCPGPPEGFIQTAKARLSEQRDAVQNLRMLERPLKPPQRKAQP